MPLCPRPLLAGSHPPHNTQQTSSGCFSPLHFHSKHRIDPSLISLHYIGNETATLEKLLPPVWDIHSEMKNLKKLLKVPHLKASGLTPALWVSHSWAPCLSSTCFLAAGLRSPSIPTPSTTCTHGHLRVHVQLPRVPNQTRLSPSF